MRNSGFTLAETLITLGVIGIVAAMTIPALINKYNEIITVAKVKETYSVFVQAEKRWEDDLDCVGDVAGCLTNYDKFSYKFFEDLTKNMKVLDTAYLGQDKSKKNWLSKTPAKRLDGKASTVHGVYADNKWFSSILLYNGVSISCCIDLYKTDITCYMDVNAEKMPNRVGLDVFPFGMGAYKNDYYKSIHPYFADDDFNSEDGGMCAIRNGKICSPDDGRSPTAYILKHNKVFDIRKLGYKK